MKESQNGVELTKMNKKSKKDDDWFLARIVGLSLLVYLVVGCLFWWKESSTNSVPAQKEERFCNEMGYSKQMAEVCIYIDAYARYINGLSMGNDGTTEQLETRRLAHKNELEALDKMAHKLNMRNK